MNKNLIRLTFISFFTLLFFTQCKKPVDKITVVKTPKPVPLSGVVIFNMGESRLQHTDLTEERAAIGASFRQGDKIITGQKSKVDLQIGESFTVRLDSNTTLEFTKFQPNQVGTTIEVTVLIGKVFANVKKTQKKEDSFQVFTPITIVTSKGTSFIVESKKLDNTIVKVVDGTVSIIPKIPAYVEINSKELEQNIDYKKLNIAYKNAEVLLDKDNELNLNYNDKILSTTVLDKKTIPLVVSEISSTNRKQQKAIFTRKEEQELKTIVLVDTMLAQKVIKINEELSSGVIDESKIDKLEQERKTIEKEILSKQETEKVRFNENISVQPRRFSSNREIIQYYERIEKIILLNGRVEIGAIIDQIESTMIVHTENGIKRISQDEIQEVIYDYQTKAKF